MLSQEEEGKLGGPRTKGAEGTSEKRRRTEEKRRTVAEDERDEEGDHGSIVAFRIPCSPSVDFQPPRPPAFYSPASWTTAAGRLAPSCNSPPPFVPSVPLSDPSCPPALVPPPPGPRYPLVALILRFPRSHPPLRRPMRLARNHQPSTAVAYLHASLRKPRPADQTLHPLLSSPLRSPRLYVARLRFFHPFHSPSSRLHPRASVSLARESDFPSLIFSLSLSLSLSLILVGCLPPCLSSLPQP